MKVVLSRPVEWRLRQSAEQVVRLVDVGDGRHPHERTSEQEQDGRQAGDGPVARCQAASERVER